jgi:hypothetical protein
MNPTTTTTTTTHSAFAAAFAAFKEQIWHGQISEQALSKVRSEMELIDLFRATQAYQTLQNAVCLSSGPAEEAAAKRMMEVSKSGKLKAQFERWIGRRKDSSTQVDEASALLQKGKL